MKPAIANRTYIIDYRLFLKWAEEYKSAKWNRALYGAS